jgi:hypothetical protein
MAALRSCRDSGGVEGRVSKVEFREVACSLVCKCLTSRVPSL